MNTRSLEKKADMLLAEAGFYKDGSIAQEIDTDEGMRALTERNAQQEFESSMVTVGLMNQDPEPDDEINPIFPPAILVR